MKGVGIVDLIEYEFPRRMVHGSNCIVGQQEHHILRTRREQLELTQQQVADKAKIQLRQYQRLESGERSVLGASMRIGLSVCAVLKLDPFFLFPETKYMNE